MKAPEQCLYCDGTDPNCGFCEMGKPLDTQEDWDASWGRVFHALSDPALAASDASPEHRDIRAGRSSEQAVREP